jgi:nitrogen fixation protein NifU and related proteins
MNGPSQHAQALHQGGRGRVQEFVSNAVDAVFFGGAHCFPPAITNDFPRGTQLTKTLQATSLPVCADVACKDVACYASRSRHGTILGMYSPELLDHFERPRNAGEIADSDVTVQVENPACGDILKLSLKVKNGSIAEIRFLAKGCVPAMACGSALTELVCGKTIEAVTGLRREDLVQAVGGLPETSIHASHLAMDALAAVLKQVKT